MAIKDTEYKSLIRTEITQHNLAYRKNWKPWQYII